MRFLPSEAFDLQMEGKEVGVGIGILVLGVEHSVEGKVMNTIDLSVATGMVVTIQVGLAALELLEKLMELLLIPGAVGLFGKDGMMAEDQNGLPVLGGRIQLGSQPCDLLVSRPTIP
jgi:hypothetical protein